MDKYHQTAPLISTQIREKRNIYLFWAAIIIIAIVYSFFSYFTPYQFDDLLAKGWYLQRNDWDESFNWKAWYQACLDRRMTDNGRIANILDYLLALWVPKWLFAVCTGIATAGMFLLITKLIQSLMPIAKRISDFSLLAIVWSVSMVCLPWRDFIMLPDYSLNYIYSTFLTLWVFYLAFRSEKHKTNALELVLYVPLGLIAGGFHEGISAPILAGFGIYALIRRFRLPLGWWILVGSFAAGTFFAALAPGVLLRVNHEMSDVTVLNLSYVILFIVPLPFLVTAAYAILAVQPSMRKHIVNLFGNQIFLVSAVGMVISTVIGISLNSQPRYGWLPEILAMILLLALMLNCLNWQQKNTRFVRIFCGCLFIFTCLFMINVIKWQSMYAREDRDIHALIDESETGTVYYDIFPPEFLPKTVLFQPMRVTWMYGFQMYTLTTIDKKGRTISVVPTNMRGLHFGENTIEVDTVYGLHIYNNNIIGIDDPRNVNPTLFMEMKTAGGDTYRFKPEKFPFVSEDGDTLMYIRHTHPELQEEIVEAHWVE